jgi:hypothetical protein
MFEDVDPFAVDPAAGAAPVDGELDAAALQDWADALADLRRDVSDEELVDRLRVLEELKAAASAAQARAAADLDASVRDRHRGMGLPAARQGIGVAAQVGLARRDSPVKGAQHLGLAKALTREMPYTLAALTEGRLSEWRATLLVRETACLSREDRARVDRELVGDRDRLAGLGDRAVAAEARRLAYQLDPGASVARSRKAAHDRRVTLRPAPDTMTNLTGLMPVAHGVATYAALSVAADQARATGDERTRGQVMADTLYERVTGQSVAIGPDVSVGLVVTDRTLFAGDDEPAVVPGYGPVPAPWARDLLRGGAQSPTTGKAGATTGTAGTTTDEAAVFVRRLFTHPHTGALVAMESRSRSFPPGLRDLLVTRDQVCRTPWCDALVRHADHATGVAEGGATDEANGQGLCEACNYDKTAPGWRAGPAPGSSLGAHLVETVKPTGHTYESRPPPLPGAPPPRPGLGWRSTARANGGPAGLDVAFLDRLGSWDRSRHAA